jgi:glucose/arabinose dehydrogenase
MWRLLAAFRLYAAVMIVGALAPASLAQIQPGTIGVRLQVVADGLATGFSSPNFGAHTGDPRFLFVGQQNGVVRILDFNQPDPLLATEFLNIPSVLGTFHNPNPNFDERGLLGGAFHPEFNNPASLGFRKFYTYTSEESGGIVSTPDFTHPEIGAGGNHQSVIREWTVGDPDGGGVMTVDTGIPSRVLMRINEPQFNHNGGTVIFGPDNYLYISLGDGGGGNDSSGGFNNATDGHTNAGNPDSPGSFQGHGNAQDRSNILGSIVRIKPTTDADASTIASANGQYRIPNDNPFVGQAGLVGEIFAYGLRNPFRISFDDATDKLYVADVGQVTREEVNVVTNGGNYGWVEREGLIQNPASPFGSDPSLYEEPASETFIDPIADYPRGAGGGLAVMGGFVYRGSVLGSLQGKYVFGDFNRDGVPGGGMMYMDVSEPGPNQVFDLMIVGDVAKPDANLHGIAQDARGELYYLFANGQVIKLVPEPAGWALALLAALFGCRWRRPRE